MNTRKQMFATIKHHTANTYRVDYSIPADECVGGCFTRGANIDEAKENFKKHYRAKKYEVVYLD